MPIINIPKSIEDAKAALDGIGALLTAKQWERAAIVYAFTANNGRGRPSKSVDTTDFTIMGFAGLGIAGLGEKQVRDYRKAWESAAAEIGNDDMLAIKPGDGIDMPDSMPTWKDHFGEPTVEVQERVARAYIARNPEVVVEAVKAVPAVAEAVTTAIAHDTTLTEEVDRKAFLKRTGSADRGRVAPAMVPVTDLNRDLSDTLSRLGTLLRKEDNGEFTVNGLNESWLRIMGLQLGERAKTGKTDGDLFDQIDALLASARGAA